MGLSTMLNNISKDGNMGVTGSWSTLHWVDYYIGGGATWDAYPGRKWTGRQIPDVNWVYRGRRW